MKKEWLALFIIILLIIVISIFDWKNSSPQKNNQPVQKSEKFTSKIEREEGEVSVLVEFVKEKSTIKIMTFNIVLNTHTVNLDGFDFQKDISFIKNPNIINPNLLNQTGSNHHRSAEITFPRNDTPFTILIYNLAAIPKREFVFEKL